jgi:hypothetical protein
MKRSVGFCLVNGVVATALWCLATASGSAATVTSGGIDKIWPKGVEATQTLDVVKGSTGSFGGGNLTHLIQGASPPFVVAGLNTNTAIRSLREKAGPDQQQDAGNGELGATTRGIVEMGLTDDRPLYDVEGDDIWVTEGGSAAQPEAFMMRVSTDNGATWSHWVYRFAQVAYNPDGDKNVAFITGFDFVKDFKLESQRMVYRVQLQNANKSDKVDNASGEGKVVFQNDPTYARAFPMLRGPTAGPDKARLPYEGNQFDPDLGYVFYANGEPPRRASEFPPEE